MAPPPFSPSATVLYSTPLKVSVSWTMLSAQNSPLQLQVMYAVPDLPPRSPSRLAHRPSDPHKFPLYAQQPNQHQKRPPVSSRTRSRSDCGAFSHKADVCGKSGSGADEDTILYRSGRLPTVDDMPHYPRCNAQRGGRTHHISPIGSERGRRTSPHPVASPQMWPPTNAIQDDTAWFPPPGLPAPHHAWPNDNHVVSRPASAPPYGRNTFPPCAHVGLMESPLEIEIIDLTGPDEVYMSCVPDKAEAPPVADPFEERFVSLKAYRKPPKQVRGPFARTVADASKQRPAFGFNVCLDYECTGGRCEFCTYLRRQNGDVLRTKLGRRLLDQRLCNVNLKVDEPDPQWAFVEDKRRLLPMKAAYLQAWSAY
ncbi:hypothetical protein C8Q80DRAFT_1269393 [Daedaleopsis nitida]|nr:hypothetical protein C8Q80DRAFT_1269393 [Daedaleopsis nitida]